MVSQNRSKLESDEWIRPSHQLIDELNSFSSVILLPYGSILCFYYPIFNQVTLDLCFQKVSNWWSLNAYWFGRWTFHKLCGTGYPQSFFWVRAFLWICSQRDHKSLVPFRQKGCHRLKHSRGTQFPLAELILQISVHISLNPRWISLDWTLL